MGSKEHFLAVASGGLVLGGMGGAVCLVMGVVGSVAGLVMGVGETLVISTAKWAPALL